MLWTGFKKAINRAGTQVLVLTGNVDKTVDYEFDFSEKRLRLMEHTLGKLENSTRNYLHQLEVIYQANSNLSKALLLFYGVNPADDVENLGKDAPIRNISQAYPIALLQDANHVESLQSPYYQSVVNPVKKFNSYYSELNKAISKRNRKLLDYDALRSKLTKLESKESDHDHAHDDQAKLESLQEQYLQAEEVFDEINTRLKTQLPMFMSHRAGYFDPLFEAFVKLQWDYFDQRYTAMSPLVKNMDAQSRQDLEEGRANHRLDVVMDKMKQLMI